MFERDLAGGSAAELEKGLRLRRGWAHITPERAFSSTRSRGRGRGVRIVWALLSAGALGLSSLLSEDPSQRPPRAGLGGALGWRTRTGPEVREWLGAGRVTASRGSGCPAEGDRQP